MIVVRVSLAAANVGVASAFAQQITRALAQWGRAEVLNLGPDRRHPGDFSVDVQLETMAGGDSAHLLRSIAEKLVAGPWDFHEDDMEEPWAVWDGRRGGEAFVRAAQWICLEVAPAAPST